MRKSLLPLLFVGALTACSAGPAADPDVQEAEVRSADGVVIRYETHGHGEPALVLVHGWMNDRSIWGQHLETLARTHRVVALDLAGHGVSGADRQNWTVDAFGEDVVAVADALDLQEMVVVGFSMGGGVVLEAAERMPDRVMGVVFVDTFNDPDQQLTPANVEEMIGTFRANWGDTAFLRAFAYMPDAPDSLIRRTAAALPAEPREHWFEIIRVYADWVKTEFRPTLQRIEAPVAAINGTREPTNVQAIRRYAPSFTLDTISGVGHAGILHRRVADFDERLLALVDRFSTAYEQ